MQCTFLFINTLYFLYINIYFQQNLLFLVSCVNVKNDRHQFTHYTHHNLNERVKITRKKSLNIIEISIKSRIPFGICKFQSINGIGFIIRNGFNNPSRIRCLYEKQNKTGITMDLDHVPYRTLKELYLKRKKIFDDESKVSTYLYRYFNITKDNIEEHLNKTIDEHFEKKENDGKRQPYMIDGTRFNGDYSTWTLPIPRNMSSYSFQGINVNASKTVDKFEECVKPEFGDEMLSSIYDLISENIPVAKNETLEFCDLYDEVGDYEYKIFDDVKIYKKDNLQDDYYASTEEMREKCRLLHKVMMHPTVFPSYLDPENPIQRTGRRRELQRKADSGRLQRLRWNMDIDPENDILRGHREKADDVIKEFYDSMEWEQPMPTYHDRNYYKRSYYEGGFGEEDRTLDNYFDVQFIGSTDAYPFAISAGMQFSWPIYWVPLLCKQHPKRRGQPIRSQMFNLGGIEPLQLWFYPEGTATSLDGYCSLKLVTPPGWCLPYRIYLFVYSEYNFVTIGPMYRESADYVASSLNTCRIINKNIIDNIENNKDYVIMGPAGNVYVGVGIVDEPLRKWNDNKYEFKYDWDEGHYDFNQWLKKQTAKPDDEHASKVIEKDRTHSIWYESHKYKYVPDRHVSRYWKTRFQNNIKWKEPDF